jgi:hypothetical protein
VRQRRAVSASESVGVQPLSSVNSFSLIGGKPRIICAIDFARADERDDFVRPEACSRRDAHFLIAAAKLTTTTLVRAGADRT